MKIIRFYLGIYSVPQKQWKERIEWVLDMTRLQEVRRRLTRELPPGWRQRLALGCALLHQPDILFLDEPTSGVDPITRQHFWRFYRSTGSGRHHGFCDHSLHGRGPPLRAHRHDQRRQDRCHGKPGGDHLPRPVPDKPDADLNDAFITLMAQAGVLMKNRAKTLNLRKILAITRKEVLSPDPGCAQPLSGLCDSAAFDSAVRLCAEP